MNLLRKLFGRQQCKVEPSRTMTHGEYSRHCKDLDKESNEFIQQVEEKPMRFWSFGEHGWYASIRRREEEVCDIRVIN